MRMSDEEVKHARDSILAMRPSLTKKQIESMAMKKKKASVDKIAIKLENRDIENSFNL